VERKLRKLQQHVSATGDPIKQEDIQALDEKINKLLFKGNIKFY